jgi:magnesium transporter
MAETTRDGTRGVGLPPGTLVHVGPPRTGAVKVTVLDYAEGTFDEKELRRAADCAPFRDRPTVTWINVDGIHDLDRVREIGDVFGLHPLLLEDIANTRQRPKIEEYGETLFLVLKMLYVDDRGRVDAEQVSLVLGRNVVISFQEREGDVFETIRDRIRNAKGRIRGMGADYLAYSLIDAIVDNYFLILEGVGDRIEELEEEIVSETDSDVLHEIRRLKTEALTLRRSVWPLREVVNALTRGESALLRQETLPYLRDVYDHTVQVVDTVETYRDLIAGMRDTYLTVLSNRMNEVMKVLTVIATIFIPLTFVAGIYGMNFERQMPELTWPYGYITVWMVMIAIAIGMIVYFKRKKWL